jgi:hypothetical protein
MVYVDPDPEIGAPAHAAGWVDPAAARLDPAEDGSDARTPGTELGDSHGDSAPAEAIDGERVEISAEPEGGGEQEGAGVGPGNAPEGIPATDTPPAPGTGAEAEGATSSDADERVPASTPDGDPWNEPALPMGWPPGMATPAGRERSESLQEHPGDADLVPEPDPTWPKLFGPIAEPQETDGDPASETTPPDQRPAVVDITVKESGVTPEPLSASESGHIGNEDTDHQAGSAGEPHGVGIEAADHANMSTAVQQAKTDEREVDLRETPADPRSVDV